MRSPCFGWGLLRDRKTCGWIRLPNISTIGSPRLCYAIVLPGRKSGFRAGCRPDSSPESIKIGPPASRRPGGGILMFSRLESGRNPVRKPDFWPGKIIVQHRVVLSDAPMLLPEGTPLSKPNSAARLRNEQASFTACQAGIRTWTSLMQEYVGNGFIAQ